MVRTINRGAVQQGRFPARSSNRCGVKQPRPGEDGRCYGRFPSPQFRG